MINPAMGWFEVKQIKCPDVPSCMNAFNNVWLAQYPRPQYIGYDNGNKFKSVFKAMCENYGITPKPNTVYNPQANGIVERVYQVLNDALRTFNLDEQELPEDKPFKQFLSATAFMIRSTYHRMLQATPVQLVFERDMFLSITFKAD